MKREKVPAHKQGNSLSFYVATFWLLYFLLPDTPHTHSMASVLFLLCLCRNGLPLPQELVCSSAPSKAEHSPSQKLGRCQSCTLGLPASEGKQRTLLFPFSMVYVCIMDTWHMYMFLWVSAHVYAGEHSHVCSCI